jgi:hypothetical protein
MPFSAPGVPWDSPLGNSFVRTLISIVPEISGGFEDCIERRPQLCAESGMQTTVLARRVARITLAVGLAQTVTLTAFLLAAPLSAAAADLSPAARPAITFIVPPESGFFAKRLDYEGIPIKAPTNVVDEAFFAAQSRLSMMLTNLPSVRARLRAAGAELHIIGRDQVTTDLPEWRQDKGKALEEYHGLTRDQRTRGMGGLLTSCGEENLLKLEKDRYRGRDICVHEFAHSILDHGVSKGVAQKVREQYHRSLDRGLWVGSYAGSNAGEFFAELTMWYFGTHGDLAMKGPKPANGREGLKTYDPEAFALLDEFYSGRLESSEASAPQVGLKPKN